MAAYNAAFEAPDNRADVSSAGRVPVDFAHLGKQTMGDKGLEVEILQLFARQARKAMAEILGGDADMRCQAAHRLKGAALAVGAADVAEAAAAIEQQPTETTLQSDLSAAVLEAELFILKLSR